MGGPVCWNLSETEFDQLSQLLVNRGLEVTLNKRETEEDLVNGGINRITFRGVLRHDGHELPFIADKHPNKEPAGKAEAWLIINDLQCKENKPVRKRVIDAVSGAFASTRQISTPPREARRINRTRVLFNVVAALVLLSVLFCALVYFAVVGWHATFH